MDALRQEFADLRSSLHERLVGQEALLDSLLLALLCNGHILLEGYPGTAKTRLVKLLGQSIEGSMGRIQFTPDLLPSDVSGAEVLHQDNAGQHLSFQEGPIFNHLVLADEINRAPAKVQSALLEAMEERQVTVAGKSYPLPEVFLVVATQNPIEQEGTYPLPEAQLDRFLLKARIDYPSAEDELNIIRMVRSEEDSVPALRKTMSQEHLLAARKAFQQVHIAPAIEQYIVNLVMATRHVDLYPESQLSAYLQLGASPRASIALDKCSRAKAWMAGRDHVLPEDVASVLPEVFAHRIQLNYRAQAESYTSADACRELLEQVLV
ncbi:AAA family ATPase [Pseudoteredinibacter isoporae]|uniref:MoxR-like ATPase n=1 Tax=Pseudoteredinibacter isoporae TaxID=570281 RepID=A0A7X0JRZ4_9GAMM|nr:MoxR family ATPase [Pseudoteredinibacter isoporae]MBB6520694.1 MoxR-like ATPase [Pseudoteredinibacter isoporae]NHO86261.1 MoxR family ATPase [Pseudoteredinibacter isoporae]NIB25288.1 MoxR family ATPase [Pseudoteredinibacter isoporae]